MSYQITKEYFPILESTRDLAEEYIITKKYDSNFLIVAETQTKGKGRKDNEWISPKGGLWFSLVLKHLSAQKSFTLFLGYCILKTLKKLCDNSINDTDTFKIKWPNDIYLYEKKVCGLICTQHHVYGMTNIGIGLNTNIAMMPKYSDSIFNLLNISIDNDVYLSSILSCIFDELHIFEERGLSLFYDYYRCHDFLNNKLLNISSGNEFYKGFYSGIKDDGGLLLVEENGQQKAIYSGSISYSG